VSFSDITERKLLENQLALANRLTSLGRLSATVAHEFNNVLMGIQPFADLIRKRSTDPQITQAADRIANSVQRGKGVTLEVLRFTQPAEPTIDAINVGTWLGTVTSNLRTVLSDSIRFDLSLPDVMSPIFIAGDASQLEQVLTNLAFNARDAMPDGGTLFIGVNHCRSGTAFRFGVVNTPDQFVHLVVRDSGIGMTPETMNHIFEPLFTTKKTGGTGLGLAVAHQIVLRHHGHIFAESSPGRGATFHIFLPVTYPQLMAPKVSAVAEKSSVRRVLLVEDDLSVSVGLSVLLEMEGIAVEVVTRGADAEAAVVRFDPEVVLLDIGLPDMDGTEVYHRLTKRWPSLPIVFSTGHGDEKKLEPYLSRPEVRFLMKPYDFPTLMAVLKSVTA
jgi:nitrogen-specific signal transduction histidine kinase